MAPAVLKMETRKQYNAFLTHTNGLARKEYAKMTSLHSYANLAEAERIVIFWVYIYYSLFLVTFFRDFFSCDFFPSTARWASNVRSS